MAYYGPQSSTPLKQEKQPQSYGAASQPFGPPPPRPPGITAFPVNVFPPKEKSVAIISGLAIGLVVVLLQTVLMFAHVDALKPFLDIESAKRHVSIENSTLAVEKEKMEHETEVMTREKELWEQAREARVPHGAFWEDVWPAWDCRAYGKREYWGVLRDIPEGWSNIDACMNMPVEIKGVTVRRPYRCGYVWGSLQIHGYWMVDWDQPDCKPWHRDYKDAGCTSYKSGKRRIEAQIVGINNRKEQDWRLLCNSTPLVWNLITYTSPTHCEERGWGRKVAMWEVPDESCF